MRVMETPEEGAALGDSAMSRSKPAWPAWLRTVAAALAIWGLIGYGLRSLVASGTIPPFGLKGSMAFDSMILLLLAAWGRRRLSVSVDGGGRRSSARRSTLVGAAAGAAVAAGNFALNMGLLKAQGGSPAPMGAAASALWQGGLEPLQIAGVALLLAVIVPVVEELFFRGFIQGGLRQDHPRWAIAASALVFANYHAASLWSPAPLILGLTLAWLYEHEGNLAAPMSCHIVNNAAAVLAMLLWRA